MIYKVSSNDIVLNWNATGNERVVQNVLNIIRTKKYEVPFMRDLGINPDFIDSSLLTYQSDIYNDVIENVNKYEPRAYVMNVKIESVDNDSNAIISVELEV